MPTPREIVERLGGHASEALALDLGSDEGLFRWLLAACLLAGRVPEERALEAFRALSLAGLDRSDALGQPQSEALAATLATARYPRPGRTALLLTRLSSALREQWDGSLTTLAGAALDQDELGATLVGLAPGLGPATVLRFLRPLRERWSAARETPLSRSALAAAQHMGWIGPGEDETGAPGALESARLREPDAPPLADLEAALERLGRRACASERPDRCPLAERCPLR